MPYEEVMGEIRESAISALLAEARKERVTLSKSQLSRVHVLQANGGENGKCLLIYQNGPFYKRQLGHYNPSDDSYEGSVPKDLCKDSAPAADQNAEGTLESDIKLAEIQRDIKESRKFLSRGPRFAQ